LANRTDAVKTGTVRKAVSKAFQLPATPIEITNSKDLVHFHVKHVSHLDRHEAVDILTARVATHFARPAKRMVVSQYYSVEMKQLRLKENQTLYKMSNDFQSLVAWMQEFTSVFDVLVRTMNEICPVDSQRDNTSDEEAAAEESTELLEDQSELLAIIRVAVQSGSLKGLKTSKAVDRLYRQLGGRWEKSTILGNLWRARNEQRRVSHSILSPLGEVVNEGTDILRRARITFNALYRDAEELHQRAIPPDALTEAKDENGNLRRKMRYVYREVLRSFNPGGIDPFKGSCQERLDRHKQEIWRLRKIIADAREHLKLSKPVPKGWKDSPDE
jgi:hypothetical protein